MSGIKKSVLGSVRLDSDVWEAVRGMDCSLNVYLRSALLEGVEALPGISVKPARQEEAVYGDGGTTDYMSPSEVVQAKKLNTLLEPLKTKAEKTCPHGKAAGWRCVFCGGKAKVE